MVAAGARQVEILNCAWVLGHGVVVGGLVIVALGPWQSLGGTISRTG
jgi:hypothetical protein